MNRRVSLLVLALLVAILLATVRQRFFVEPEDEEPPRDDGWAPTAEVRTPNFLLRSSAPPDLTARLGDALEALHRAMDATVGELPTRVAGGGPMRIHLYADRAEFRRVNHVNNWAEAFYKEPVSRLYLDPTSANPWHWGLHEAAHQIVREAYGLHLRRWLNEGVATYFGGSHLAGETLETGLADAASSPNLVHRRAGAHEWAVTPVPSRLTTSPPSCARPPGRRGTRRGESSRGCADTMHVHLDMSIRGIQCPKRLDPNEIRRVYPCRDRVNN